MAFGPATAKPAFADRFEQLIGGLGVEEVIGWPTDPVAPSSSNVEIGYAQGVFLDEFSARFDDVAHQAGENFVGDVGDSEEALAAVVAFAALKAGADRPDFDRRRRQADGYKQFRCWLSAS